MPRFYPPRNARPAWLWPWTAIFFCAAFYWACSWTASRDLPAVTDEIAHVVGGLFEWKYGVSHLQPENAYLVKHWSTLPLIQNAPKLAEVPADVPFDSAMMVIGHRTFYEEGNDPAHLLRVARGMSAVIGALLVVFIGGWGLRIWGSHGGILAAALAAFCPTLLANGGLVLSDTALALSLLISSTASWWMLGRPSFWRVTVCGAAMALGLLAKMSGVLVVPLLGVLLAARMVQTRQNILPEKPKLLPLFSGSVSACVVAGFFLWMAYGFHFPMFAHAEAPRPIYSEGWQSFAASANFMVRIVVYLRRWHALPEFWLYGLAHTLDHLSGRHAFLNGSVKTGGWFWFFPYTWLVKTPLTLFGLLLLGIAAPWSRREKSPPPPVAERLWKATPLLALFGVYWVVALTSSTNIGHRHLLPIYPPMLILAGGAAWFWSAPRFSTRLLALMLPLLFAIESWLIRPDYVAYFNVLAGGPNQGYLHLADGSIDMGQDLNRLSAWWSSQSSEASSTPLYLSYFGSADPVTHGVKAVRFGDTGFDLRPRSEPARVRGGWFCFSVTLYHGLYTLTPGRWTGENEAQYLRLLPILHDRPPTHAEAVTFEHLQFGRLRDWLRQRPPDHRIGYTMLLFRLTDADVFAALYGPLKPAPWRAQSLSFLPVIK